MLRRELRWMKWKYTTSNNELCTSETHHCTMHKHMLADQLRHRQYTYTHIHTYSHIHREGKIRSYSANNLDKKSLNGKSALHTEMEWNDNKSNSNSSNTTTTTTSNTSSSNSNNNFTSNQQEHTNTQQASSSSSTGRVREYQINRLFGY